LADIGGYTTNEILQNGGWTAIPHELAGAQISPSAKVIAFTLRSLFINGATEIKITQHSLELFLGMAKNTVRSALNELKSGNLIAETPVGGLTMLRPSDWSVPISPMALIRSKIDPSPEMDQKLIHTAVNNGSKIDPSQRKDQKLILSDGSKIDPSTPMDQKLIHEDQKLIHDGSKIDPSKDQKLIHEVPASPELGGVSEPLNTYKTFKTSKTRHKPIGAKKPSDSEMAVEVESLRNRYNDRVAIEWMEQGLAATRKTGTLSLSVIHRLHRYLANVSPEIVETCVKTYNDRCHGEKDERYLMGIVRNEIKQRSESGEDITIPANAGAKGPYVGWSRERIENAKRRAETFPTWHWWLNPDTFKYQLTKDREKIRETVSKKGFTDQDYEDTSIAFLEQFSGDKVAAWRNIEDRYNRAYTPKEQAT